MLRSKTRRRVAAKTAAGVIGAGILLGAVPAIASMTAVAKPVTYTCTAASGTATAGTYKMQMDLTGPLTAPTPSATVVVTWKAGQPPMPPNLVAPVAIAAGDRIVIEADAAISGPVPTPSGSIHSVLATTTPGVVAVNGVLPPLPTVLVTVVPTAAGVVTVRPDAFSVSHLVGPGAGTETLVYDCLVASQAEATTAALLVTVKPSGAATGTPTTTPTTTPSDTTTPTTTPTTATPEPTVTITRTKTAKPTKSREPGKVAETPGGGAATGGGGDAGPDARMFVLGGTAMIMAAGIGGLMMRRRTSTRG
ncbi:hypothetical protein ACFQ08_27080 [Streptosporangium algeriense]|uniref:Gram-positive cocci surface proteins LPxTG domain-containing protein n=1 Tax=Streptosporangium algeriense TaxID=1682748 RepID=A0ABW3DZ43_9ACTN